jgi:hypothetical protein
LQAWQAFWQQHLVPTRTSVQRLGEKYGFTAEAFAPFYAGLEQQPEQLDPQILQRWGLGSLLDNLLLKDDQGVQILTLIPDRPELISRLESDLDTLSGVTLVSQSRFGRQLSREIGADFSRFITAAGVAVLVLLLLLFRRLPEVLLALLPVLTGLIVMFGGMGWLGLEMNLFNVVASILIIGLGVDYGIFMVCHGQQDEELASSRAVLVSGLTTLVGFGALVLAKHPALHSIGLTVLLGISAAVPTGYSSIPTEEAMMLRIWVLITVFALSACAPSTPPLYLQEDCRAELTSAQLLDRHWLLKPGIWRLRQSALLEIGHKKIPLEGFLRLDLNKRQARLLAMNELGVVLFDLQVTAEDEELQRAIPQLMQMKGLARGVAQSLRQIYLVPQPQRIDRLEHAGNSQRLSRRVDGGELGFVFDCFGDLRESRLRTEDDDWRVVYDQYRLFEGARLPEQVVMNDYQHNIKLSLWVREVKQEP